MSVRLLRNSWLAAVAFWLLLPASAFAGMPSVSLTDLARARLSSISFFLLSILICTVVVQQLWNWVRRDFSRLPGLSFRAALAAVLLWGLMFIVVLTMISGARELMTPGAWIRTGLTSKLAVDASGPTEDRVAMEVTRQLQLQNERLQRLQLLGIELRRWTEQHSGKYPTQEQFAALPESLRLVPGDLPTAYLYVPPAGEVESVPDTGDAPLILEPAIFGSSPQLALYRSGLVAPAGSLP